MSQWCVFPISWHLNILGNYVITRYYRLFGMVFTEIYRIIWNKKKCLVPSEKRESCHSPSNVLLHIHICLFYPFANIRLQLVTDIYEFHLISKKCFIYNSIWRFDYRFFSLFIRIICKLSTGMNHCAHLKNSHRLFSIPSFKHKWAAFRILNQIGTIGHDSFSDSLHRFSAIDFCKFYIFEFISLLKILNCI